MQRMIQHEPGSAPLPIRLRLAALLCVLLVGMAGIAQAAHVHGDWLPSAAAHASAHDSAAPAGISEDACPLCMAMHSALPVTGTAAPLAALLVAVAILLVATRKPRSFRCFAAFSRPPPTLIL